MYIIDSNTLIDYKSNVYPKKVSEFLNNVLDQEAFVSFVTKIEVLGFNFAEPGSQIDMENFLETFPLIMVNSEIIELSIQIRKLKKIGLPDAIIAATTLLFDFTLISRNKKDFQNIPNLKFINPMEL